MTRYLLLTLTLVVYALPARADVTLIDNTELKRLIADGIPIIDIRRPDEWRHTGVVGGSHLVTFFDERGRYDVRSWIAKLSAVAGRDDPFILICRTGNRTGAVSRFLDIELGYSRVYDVADGIVQWMADGHATVPPEL